MAALLSWAALNIIGGGCDVVKQVAEAQRLVYDAVDREIAEWGIEHNEQGHRADAYLYCLETRCPECKWLVPLVGGKIDRPADAPPFAGKSLAPAFQKDDTVQREFLYFNHNKNRALHAGDWKIVAKGESGPWELYDMRTDRCEQKDLAATDPERLRRLAAVWNQQDSLYVKQRESAPASTKPLMPARA